MIERIELVNFRNFEKLQLNTPYPDVVLTGPNGSGKTNLLEAIYFLSILRSFRGASVKEMRRIGTRAFNLGVDLRRRNRTEKIKLLETENSGRELWINATRLRKASEFIREFRAVAFVPEDREMVAGSSGFRRRFFDMLISALDAGYLSALSSYHKALIQRNRALKMTNLKLAGAFEPEMAQQAPEIGRKRAQYAEIVAQEVNQMLGSAGELTITHQSDYPLDSAEILQGFQNSRAREQLRGCTLSGPQLDEFELRFRGKVMRHYASTGQKRIISLLLKLAEFKILRADSSTPVLALVDDVTGELDAQNQELFFQTIQAADQRFYTFTAFPAQANFAGKFELNIAEKLPKEEVKNVDSQCQ